MGNVILVGGVYDGDIIDVPLNKDRVVMIYNPINDWNPSSKSKVTRLSDMQDIYYYHKRTIGDVRLFCHFK